MKLGVIGTGKMGRALMEGILRAGLSRPSDTYVHDAYEAAVEAVTSDLGVEAAGSNAAVVENADVVLLCVKPQGFSEMLRETGEADERLFISIAAGIRIATIEEAVQNRHRVIRVMPNTPALVGKGASAYSLGSRATHHDAELAEHLLGSVGYVTQVPENLLDAVTALSGSGPAYVFAMIESLVAGAVDVGLDEETSLALATHTVAGAAELLLRTGESPATLRKNVTSPNGTTFAALESFKANGLDRIVREAVKAARDRSVELAGGK